MIYNLTGIFKNNWYFLSLLCFVAVLPFSQALVSIFAGFILFVAILEGKWHTKRAYIKQRKILLFLPAIFAVYLLSSIFTFNSGEALYDIRKSLFFFVIPLAFLIGKEINDQQKRAIFYLFALAIFVSTIVAIIRWRLFIDQTGFEVHRISMISHIRFSFQLILAIWFFVLFIFKNNKSLPHYQTVFFILLTVYFFAFTFFQQSLTGVIAFTGSVIFFIVYTLLRKHSKHRKYYILTAVLLFVLPVIYVSWVVKSFYSIEQPDKNTIEKTTPQGNLYEHNFEDPLVENGRYVYLYVCHSEMREEWNKISEIKYDSLGNTNFPIHSTLIRYLTSKGLKKDAEGVRALTEQDVRNIQNGMANVIFYEKKFSLYPRIYQTVWEYYVYSKTGNANSQSFSQRIEYSVAAVSIIKKHPFFGVGTGYWKEEFKNTYINSGSKLNEEHYASSHNQYLNYLVKFGIFGFLAIVFLLVYPIINTKRYKDPLFLVFLVFMALANFADSNFETHMGSSFFLFFYCLFLVSGSDSFLVPDKKSDKE